MRGVKVNINSYESRLLFWGFHQKQNAKLNFTYCRSNFEFFHTRPRGRGWGRFLHCRWSDWSRLAEYNTLSSLVVQIYFPPFIDLFDLQIDRSVVIMNIRYFKILLINFALRFALLWFRFFFFILLSCSLGVRSFPFFYNYSLSTGQNLIAKHLPRSKFQTISKVFTMVQGSGSLGFHHKWALNCFV